MIFGAIKNSIDNLAMNYKVRFDYISIKLKWLSLLGAIGFPGFYVVWTYIIPQPYENIWLRVVGFFLCMNLYGTEVFGNYLGKHKTFFTYITLTWCLPYFFTLMMLYNDINIVWFGSALCAVIYLSLLLDPWNLTISYTTGTTAAVATYLILTGNTLPPSYTETIPIFLFALVGGNGLNHSSDMIVHRDRLKAVKAIGSSIAHEMRTPLLGIRMDMEAIQELMPRLMEGHAWAREHGWRGPGIPPVRMAGLQRALERIGHQTDYANTVINMLLMNIQEQRFDSSLFSTLSMQTTVEQALDSYPLHKEDRSAFSIKIPNGDFLYRGSDLLMRHVLFNIFKNSLRAIKEARGGTVTITLLADPTSFANCLRIRDTGTGILVDDLPHVFEPFYSGRHDGTRVGVGLAFCRRVIESFDGAITCASNYGEFTEFNIHLPATHESHHLERGIFLPPQSSE
mgnify:CR=1 FL=1